MRLCLSGEDGFAVIVAMMGLLVMSALAVALVLGTSIDTMIARNFRDAAGAAYAADAVGSYAVQELSAAEDWSAILSGVTGSTWSDGLPDGARTLRDGTIINLTEIRNLANCGAIRTCSDADIVAIDLARPWGINNPRWRLFAWGWLSDLRPETGVGSDLYVVVLVGDDPAESDGDPLVDGSEPDNPGAGVLLLRAEAFGPGGVYAASEQTVKRLGEAELIGNPGLLPVRLVSWRAAP